MRFGAYRRYEEPRVLVSNAVMALLAGAQMAAHMLQLTHGSDRLLPEIFPKVEHIDRINLTSDAARGILVGADTHLGAMAVPYVLALHEDYLRTCLELFGRGGASLSQRADRFRLVEQHEEIERVTNSPFTVSSLQQLHTLRLMRNCTIHSGGRASQPLIRQVSGWSTDAETGWVKLTRRSPRGLAVGDTVEFSHGEILIALAVTKTLAREANQLLQPTVPTAVWADLLVEDLIEQMPTVLRSPDVVRRARGLARHDYQPLGLTDADIMAALGRA